jgi:hypothetical protein
VSQGLIENIKELAGKGSDADAASYAASQTKKRASSKSDGFEKIPTKKRPASTNDAMGTGFTGRAQPGSFARGGKVRKTGFAKVHKGEEVLTKSQQKKLRAKGRGRSKRR